MIVVKVFFSTVPRLLWQIALLCLLDLYIYTNKYPNVKQLSQAINQVGSLNVYTADNMNLVSLSVRATDGDLVSLRARAFSDDDL